MIFLDTETIGLHGMPVILQYAYDDGPIIIHSFWQEEIEDTLTLIEDFCNHPEGICGFNLAFDWFQLSKVYTTFRLVDRTIVPLHQIDEIAVAEKKARNGPCLRPQAALDLMLHARKGPYQSTMDRNDIFIKRVPSVLTQHLIDYLDTAVPLKDIYFARKSNPKQRWQEQDITNEFGDVDPHFKNIVLRFAPSSALKALAVDALGIASDDIIKYASVNPPSYNKVNELGYAPFALAVGQVGAWNKAWPFWVWEDVFFWKTNTLARKYATDDIVYTRNLYKYFGCPPSNDTDSILSCMVASVRWHGYTVDVAALAKLRTDAQAMIDSLPFNVNSPAICKKYLEQVMSPVEFGMLLVDGKVSTKKVLLEDIAKWTNGDVCVLCEGMGCPKCNNGIAEGTEPHPAASRAQEILDARSACKEIELYDKLILAGRFHASFKVIGALSSRMAGADGLNAQGIKRATYVREAFTLKDEGMILCGGDFSAFELSIMDAVYPDPKMHAELTGDKKIHALWGQRYFFPTMSYDEIVMTKDTARTPWEDKYSRSKQGVFAVCYFGEGFTLVTRVGLPEDVALKAYESIMRDYPEFAQKREVVAEMFCSMKQPGGLGSKVEWSDPAEFIESLLGFRRYFTLENQICKALYNLAESPPKAWQAINMKVTRRDRVQTACGALRSALFGAAFGMQSSNKRAAGNHRIQSTGAGITKELEVELWELQPKGINSWQIAPMNIHDEIMAPMVPALAQKAQSIVQAFVEKTKSVVPLVKVDWHSDISSWAGKGGAPKDVDESARDTELEETLL